MTKIFISYRRADSQETTERIHDHLVEYFGENSVFQDVESIPIGVDFRSQLSSAVNECDVVLVVIGPEWTRFIKERAHEPNDFVRIEVESALKLRKWVIPVLVRGAQMPSPSDLPASIRDVCWLNAAKVRPNPDFRHDCQILADSIHVRVTGSSKQPFTSSRKRVTHALPAPFEWIDIPAGKVEVIPDHSPLVVPNAMYLKRPTVFEVAAFTIGKYPVTNAQFAEFMQAGGYRERRWWTDSGWKAAQQGIVLVGLIAPKPGDGPWTSPYYWRDQKWNGAEFPVVGVSWYEAVAFCRWLSESLGENILLPTEQQWQRAAQGNDGRQFPWGNEWDGKRCNTIESGIQHTTPVTQYESKGDTPFHVVDMAGNVWEWCSTSLVNGRAIYEGDETRMRRGGSWNTPYTYARVAYQCLGGIPSNRANDIGFRVVRIPAV